MIKNSYKTIVTGSTVFNGAALCLKLLQKVDNVIGIDNHNDYYDKNIKEARFENLNKYKNYVYYRLDLTKKEELEVIFKKYKLGKGINLAAQAGVRYSMKNPFAYIENNIIGFAKILENCRIHNVKHLIYLSISSVYGAKTNLPFSEDQNTNHAILGHAASKKSNELMARVYSHLYRLPTTGLRFFNVYGPWGRPDMALFKFTKNILEEKIIDVFNYGKHTRDFTYMDDIVEEVTNAT